MISEVLQDLKGIGKNRNMFSKKGESANVPVIEKAKGTVPDSSPTDWSGGTSLRVTEWVSYGRRWEVTLRSPARLPVKALPCGCHSPWAGSPDC